MFLSYLTGIPHEALLVMGGFPPLKRAYHVPRFHVDVPRELPIVFEKADKQLEEVVRVSFANPFHISDCTFAVIETIRASPLI